MNYKWILVKDELPEINEQVLTKDENEQYDIIEYSGNNRDFKISDLDCECCNQLPNIKYWMRFPKCEEK